MKSHTRICIVILGDDLICFADIYSKKECNKFYIPECFEQVLYQFFGSGGVRPNCR